MTIRKIKIPDDEALRESLDNLYQKQEHLTLARWSLEIAARVISLTELAVADYPEIQQGFEQNKLWQTGDARMHDVRQAGFALHRRAKTQTDAIKLNTLRTIGQAVSSGHMPDHALVASDYAVKVIHLLFPHDQAKITAERQWQIEKLQELAED